MRNKKCENKKFIARRISSQSRMDADYYLLVGVAPERQGRDEGWPVSYYMGWRVTMS